MPQYKLTPQAAEDLEQIFVYGIERFGVEQAISYVQTLERRFEALGENPKLYPEVNKIRQGYRRSVCGIHSIYYRVVGNIIEIMSIIGRQDLQARL